MLVLIISTISPFISQMKAFSILFKLNFKHYNNISVNTYFLTKHSSIIFGTTSPSSFISVILKFYEFNKSFYEATSKWTDCKALK